MYNFHGQVWNMHIDKLEKWNTDDPHSVYRFMVMLNDYEPENGDTLFNMAISFTLDIVQAKYTVLIGIMFHIVLQMQDIVLVVHY